MGLLVGPDHGLFSQHEVLQFVIVRHVPSGDESGRTRRRVAQTERWQGDVEHSENVGGKLFYLLCKVNWPHKIEKNNILFLNLLLHALILLILQCCEADHVLVVQLEIVHLQLQSVATQVPFQQLNNTERITVSEVAARDSS